jgi:hypothetical protein
MPPTFQADTKLKSGTGYWDFKCDKFSAEQNKLAVEVDGGVWRLDAVDATDGKAQFTEWAPGKVVWDDLSVTFQMNNQTGGLGKLAKEIATGANNSGNRFNCTLTFKDSAGKGKMSINYIECQIVQHNRNGFEATDSGSAATETIVFRPNRCECKKG